jgi:hypothetical protein
MTQSDSNSDQYLSYFLHKDMITAIFVSTAWWFDFHEKAVLAMQSNRPLDEVSHHRCPWKENQSVAICQKKKYFWSKLKQTKHSGNNRLNFWWATLFCQFTCRLWQCHAISRNHENYLLSIGFQASCGVVTLVI